MKNTKIVALSGAALLVAVVVVMSFRGRESNGSHRDKVLTGC